MCGVVGVYRQNPEINAYEDALKGLDALQGRGRQSAGIAVADIDPSTGISSFIEKRGHGLVSSVFSEVSGLVGRVALGEVRYGTHGGPDILLPDVNKAQGFAFAMNGTLPVMDDLKVHCELAGARPNALNDAQMMAYAISSRFNEGRELEEAVRLSVSLFKGAFSSIAMRVGSDKRMVAFRDDRGIRPLSIGQFEDGGYAFASETRALRRMRAEFMRDVEPGEIVVVEDGELHSSRFRDPRPRFGAFELVYLMHSSSEFNGETVRSIRRRFGAQLAIEQPPRIGEKENILVISVPQTAISAGEAYAHALGLEHSTSVIDEKNDVGRTFILPTQEERTDSLKDKAQVANDSELRGKDILLVDDSIVRGNTIRNIVEQLRGAGVASISVRVASPPVLYPNHYGEDTPDQMELVAARLDNEEELKIDLGCDDIGFLSLDGLVNAIGLPYDQLDLSCFNGDYPTSIGKHNNARIKKPALTKYLN